jgi:putative ABC transport system permease protein
MMLWQDVRFAARLLVKDRWFTLAAATALALGIGANAAVFTFVNAVLLRGLPFNNPDRIVAMSVMNAKGQRNGVSYPEFNDFSHPSPEQAVRSARTSMSARKERREQYRGPTSPPACFL